MNRNECHDDQQKASVEDMCLPCDEILWFVAPVRWNAESLFTVSQPQGAAGSFHSPSSASQDVHHWIPKVQELKPNNVDDVFMPSHLAVCVASLLDHTLLCLAPSNRILSLMISSCRAPVAGPTAGQTHDQSGHCWR